MHLLTCTQRPWSDIQSQKRQLQGMRSAGPPGFSNYNIYTQESTCANIHTLSKCPEITPHATPGTFKTNSIRIQQQNMACIKVEREIKNTHYVQNCFPLLRHSSSVQNHDRKGLASSCLRATAEITSNISNEEMTCQHEPTHESKGLASCCFRITHGWDD